MPSTTIETKADYDDAHVARLIEAVFAAQVDALGASDEYRNVRYIQHEAARFASPPAKRDRHIHIEISLFTGRPADVKQDLFTKTVDRLAALGHPREEVSIVLHEQPRENWYFGT